MSNSENINPNLLGSSSHPKKYVLSQKRSSVGANQLGESNQSQLFQLQNSDNYYFQKQQASKVAKAPPYSYANFSEFSNQMKNQNNRQMRNEQNLIQQQQQQQQQLYKQKSNVNVQPYNNASARRYLNINDSINMSLQSGGCQNSISQDPHHHNHYHPYQAEYINHSKPKQTIQTPSSYYLTKVQQTQPLSDIAPSPIPMIQSPIQQQPTLTTLNYENYPIITGPQQPLYRQNIMERIISPTFSQNTLKSGHKFDVWRQQHNPANYLRQFNKNSTSLRQQQNDSDKNISKYQSVPQSTKSNCSKITQFSRCQDKQKKNSKKFRFINKGLKSTIPRANISLQSSSNHSYKHSTCNNNTIDSGFFHKKSSNSICSQQIGNNNYLELQSTKNSNQQPIRLVQTSRSDASAFVFPTTSINTEMYNSKQSEKSQYRSNSSKLSTRNSSSCRRAKNQQEIKNKVNLTSCQKRLNPKIMRDGAFSRIHSIMYNNRNNSCSKKNTGLPPRQHSQSVSQNKRFIKKRRGTIGDDPFCSQSCYQNMSSNSQQNRTDFNSSLSSYTTNRPPPQYSQRFLSSYHSARMNTPSSNFSNTFNSTLNALEYLGRAETSRVQNKNSSDIIEENLSSNKLPYKVINISMENDIHSKARDEKLQEIMENRIEKENSSAKRCESLQIVNSVTLIKSQHHPESTIFGGSCSNGTLRASKEELIQYQKDIDSARFPGAGIPSPSIKQKEKNFIQQSKEQQTKIGQQQIVQHYFKNAKVFQPPNNHQNQQVEPRKLGKDVSTSINVKDIQTIWQQRQSDPEPKQGIFKVQGTPVFPGVISHHRKADSRQSLQGATHTNQFSLSFANSSSIFNRNLQNSLVSGRNNNTNNAFDYIANNSQLSVNNPLENTWKNGTSKLSSNFSDLQLWSLSPPTQPKNKENKQMTPIQQHMKDSKKDSRPQSPTRSVVASQQYLTAKKDFQKVLNSKFDYFTLHVNRPSYSACGQNTVSHKKASSDYFKEDMQMPFDNNGYNQTFKNNDLIVSTQNRYSLHRRSQSCNRQSLIDRHYLIQTTEESKVQESMKSKKLQDQQSLSKLEQQPSSFLLKDHTFMCDGAKLASDRLAILYDDQKTQRAYNNDNYINVQETNSRISETGSVDITYQSNEIGEISKFIEQASKEMIVKKKSDDDDDDANKNFNAQIEGIINQQQLENYLNQNINFQKSNNNNPNDSSNGDLGEITQNLTQKFNQSLSPGSKSLMIQNERYWKVDDTTGSIYQAMNDESFKKQNNRTTQFIDVNDDDDDDDQNLPPAQECLQKSQLLTFLDSQSQKQNLIRVFQNRNNISNFQNSLSTIREQNSFSSSNLLSSVFNGSSSHGRFVEVQSSQDMLNVLQLQQQLKSNRDKKNFTFYTGDESFTINSNNTNNRLLEELSNAKTLKSSVEILSKLRKKTQEKQKQKSKLKKEDEKLVDFSLSKSIKSELDSSIDLKSSIKNFSISPMFVRDD